MSSRQLPIPHPRDRFTALTPGSLRLLCYRDRIRRIARYWSEGAGRETGGVSWRSVVTLPTGPHALVGEPDGGSWPTARQCGPPAGTGTSAVKASNFRTESEDDSVPSPCGTPMCAPKAGEQQRWRTRRTLELRCSPHRKHIRDP